MGYRWEAREGCAGFQGKVGRGLTGYLRKVSNAENIRVALELKSELLKLVNSREILLWEEGRRWFQLKQGLYKLVFGSEDDERKKQTWSSFVAQMGVPLGTVEFKTSLYKKWIHELGFEIHQICDIHSRKLHRAIPYATKERGQELVDNARALSFSDFIIYLKGEDSVCEHQERETVVKCAKCKRQL